MNSTVAALLCWLGPRVRISPLGVNPGSRQQSALSVETIIVFLPGPGFVFLVSASLPASVHFAWNGARRLPAERRHEHQRDSAPHRADVPRRDATVTNQNARLELRSCRMRQARRRRFDSYREVCLKMSTSNSVLTGPLELQTRFLYPFFIRRNHVSEACELLVQSTVARKTR